VKYIETKRLLLRPITDSDENDVYAYCRNPNVGIHAGWKPHESMNETREIMKTLFIGKDDVFGVVLKETGKLFGSIGLVPDPKRQNDRARMLGYAIGEDYWGRGFTTEATLALLRYGFGQGDIDLISAYCYPYNGRSIGVLRKCGFHYEGRLSLAERRYDGTVLDHECWSITKDKML
jgi:putative acetyltransferase